MIDKILLIFMFSMLFSKAQIPNNDSLSKASDLVNKLVRNSPEKASRLIIGHEEKIYQDISFWLEYHLPHPFLSEAREIVPEKVVVVQITYSPTGQVNVPAIGSTLLFVVQTHSGWKAIPTNYLAIYMSKGEDAVIKKMQEDISKEPLTSQQDFMDSFHKSLKIRRASDISDVVSLTRSFQSVGLPIDKVVDPPPETYQMKE